MMKNNYLLRYGDRDWRGDKKLPIKVWGFSKNRVGIK
jgi:hypothetical protein